MAVKPMVGRQASPVSGIDVVEFDRLAARRVLGERAQALHRIGPRIAHHRIGRARVAVAPRRHHAGRCVFDLGRVGAVLRRLQFALDRVGAFEIDEQRQVERIEPDHRAFAVMTMIVPRAAGREDQVAALHHAFFAVDDRVGAFALDDDARRARRVAVRRRLLARQQQLHAAEDRPATCIAPGPRPGSDRISTRRSAFSTGVSSPARSSSGRILSNAHRQALLCGTGVSCGSALRISGHSGVVLAASSSAR